MMMRWTNPALLALSVATLLVVMVAACADENGEPVPEPVGCQIEALGCKSAGSGSGTYEQARDRAADGEGCIDWLYDADTRNLRLIHRNAALNCCPDSVSVVTVEAGLLAIDETVIDGLCDCLCLYDLVFEVSNLPPGTYEVAVAENYLLDDDPPLVGSLDLAAETEGSFCAPREHYPWEY